MISHEPLGAVKYFVRWRVRYEIIGEPFAACNDAQRCLSISPSVYMRRPIPRPSLSEETFLPNNGKSVDSHGDAMYTAE